MRAFERDMIDHVGGTPSATEKLLISRLARTSLRIMLLEEKLDGGTWTDLDARTHAGLQTAFTRMLGSLGMKSPPVPLPVPAPAEVPQKVTLREYLNSKEAAK
ncbi:MAG TPA: hypothetical protein VNC39_09420 [Acidocella sp.]|nr:hypothetical protein [Acidocella sp.]